jgi:acyl-CoA synthetase (AMP-forming)/AMP-acid ligase II
VPGLTVVCAYGPTEHSAITTVHPVDDPSDVDGALPIGRPVLGSGVHVLDERGRLVPPGAVGELHTSGVGLAVGYLGDPAETDRRFGHFSADVPERLYRTGDLVRFDAAGNLRFLGRGDDQVKIRGFRIELGAIAQALLECAGVHDAVVFATGATSASKRIVAAVVPSPGAAVDPAGLRDALAGRLPAYMVPTLWTIVEHVPVTKNGKTDRAALLAAAAPAG